MVLRSLKRAMYDLAERETDQVGITTSTVDSAPCQTLPLPLALNPRLPLPPRPVRNPHLHPNPHPPAHRTTLSSPVHHISTPPSSRPHKNPNCPLHHPTTPPPAPPSANHPHPTFSHPNDPPSRNFARPKAPKRAPQSFAPYGTRYLLYRTSGLVRRPLSACASPGKIRARRSVLNALRDSGGCMKRSWCAGVRRNDRRRGYGVERMMFSLDSRPVVRMDRRLMGLRPRMQV